MAKRSFIALINPKTTKRSGMGKAVPGNLQRPSKTRQTQRIAPKFQVLAQKLEAKALEVRLAAPGIPAEEVIVMETIGTLQDFQNAVRRVDGLEWLLDLEESVDPDDDFFDVENREAALTAHLYVVSTNLEALRQLKALWAQYRRGKTLDWGFGKFKTVFENLKDLRFWGVEDRLRETGIVDYWKDELEFLQEKGIPFEIELWFRESSDRRREAEIEIERLVTGEGGQLLRAPSVFPQIAYHGVLATVPRASVRSLIDDRSHPLLSSARVRAFRPCGQSMHPLESLDQSELGAVERPDGDAGGEVRLALLDGLPLERHVCLSGRISVDDPEDYARTYPAQDRQHGTAMASLILNGDLGGESDPPLETRLYVRPILRPDGQDSNRPRNERIPPDVCPVDLLHECVMRMKGAGNLEGLAERVSAVNFSIGDAARPFHAFPSPWARMLDWLSWRYRLLFVVSAGNCRDDIALNTPSGEVEGESEDEFRRRVLKALHEQSRLRRILAPAEAMNVLTVGAAHDDLSIPAENDPRIDPLGSNLLASPISAMGSGAGRSIKPDVLMPGGRARFNLLPNGETSVLRYSGSSRPPGNKVACPAPRGETGRTMHTRGTSNATALTTRLCGRILEELDRLVADGLEIPSEYHALATKALIVHGSSWGEAAWEQMSAALQTNPPMDRGKFASSRLAPFMGYGRVDPDRCLGGSDHRATMIGWNSLKRDQAHEYRIPLPPSLNAMKVYRRLTVTLAWFSPINSAHSAYRRARLWFDSPSDILKTTREENDWRAVRRGTVQHEIFGGEKATAFPETASFEIKVNCAAHAGKLTEPIPYVLAVTLEVAEAVGLPIYQEIQERIAARVGVRG